MPEFALFDLLHPWFSQADQWLAQLLPGVLRIVLWTLLLMWLPPLFYHTLMPRKRVQDWRMDAWFQREIQRTLKHIKTDPSARKQNDGTRHGKKARIYNAKVQMLHLPLFLLSLFFAFSLLLWLPKQFAWQLPQAGQWVNVQPVPVQIRQPALQWQPQAAGIWSEKLQAWVLQWPQGGQSLRMLNPQGQEVFRLQANIAGAHIEKQHWWHWFSSDTAAYLSPASRFERIDIELREQHYLSWGPLWLRQWWAISAAVVVGVALWRFIRRTREQHKKKKLQRQIAEIKAGNTSSVTKKSMKV
jgi:hypothetical protein